jgi:hypothetical protein
MLNLSYESQSKLDKIKFEHENEKLKLEEIHENEVRNLNQRNKAL